MKEKIAFSQTEIRRSTNSSGYGVFALKNFRKGDIIEECPCISLSEQAANGLRNYFFNTSDDDVQPLLPLGHGCLYKHTALPNATWNFDKDAQLLTFQALKNISKDNEILIYYSPQSFPSRQIESQLPYKRIKRFLLILARIGFVALLFGIFITGVFSSQKRDFHHQQTEKKPISPKKPIGIQ